MSELTPTKVSIKQLCYYVEKWERYGFIECGVSTYCGWFDFSKLPFRYFQIIPNRLFSHCKAFKLENLYVLLNNDKMTKIRDYINKSIVLKELRRK